MTVLAIRLQNFMAFQDTNWIDLRSISLLFGLNSSGKSAIVRALRLLKQSLDFEAKNGPLVFRHEYQLDLGSFLSALHRGFPALIDSEYESELTVQNRWLQAQRMTFSFRCKLSYEVQKLVIGWVNQTRSVPITERNAPEWIEYSLQYSHEKDQVKLVAIMAEIVLDTAIESDRSLLFAVSLRDFVSKKPDPTNDYDVEWSRWSWEGDFSIGATSIHSPTPFHQIEPVIGKSFLPELQSKNGIQYKRTTDQLQTDFDRCGFMLESLSQTIREFLAAIVHLGPLRPFPQRLYMLDRHETMRWREQGWGALIDILHSRTSDANIRSQFLQEVDKWLQNLKLGNSLITDTKWISADDDLVSSISLYKNEEEIHNLVDVGFGTSQVLPIILACLSAKPGQLIIIEQPELHLHPRAQSSLCDMFIATRIKGIRFLIETHSEHLLLRLRRRIAETSVEMVQLQPTDLSLAEQSIAVFFADFQSKKQCSKLHNIGVSKLGDMSELPDSLYDFFSDDLDETAALTAARLRAKIFRAND